MIGITNATEMKIEKYRNIRYIRLWYEKNSVNNAGHLVEFEAWDIEGINRALGINFTVVSGTATSLSAATDGSFSHTGGSGFININANTEIQLNLGAVYKIKKIKIWGYWDDSRAYTYRLRISPNGTDWDIIYDARYDGIYIETSNGKTFDFSIYQYKKIT